MNPESSGPMPTEEPLHTRLAKEIGGWSVHVAETKELAPSTKLRDLLHEVRELEQPTGQPEEVVEAFEEFMKKEFKEPAPANETQVGGEHYKTGGEEHWDRAWRLDYDCFQYIITKWVERWKKKGGLQDLRKAQHAIAKYIEVVEAKQRPADPTYMDIPNDKVLRGKMVEAKEKGFFEEATKANETLDDIMYRERPSRFKDPKDWTQEERDVVAEAVMNNNPLINSLHEELKNMDAVLGGECNCCPQVPVPKSWIHQFECPARDKLAQPSPAERSSQMSDMYDDMRNLWHEINKLHKHWQGTKKPVETRSTDYFTYEGGKAKEDYWTCKACNEHFTTWRKLTTVAPHEVHECSVEAVAGPSYVDQG